MKKLSQKSNLLILIVGLCFIQSVSATPDMDKGLALFAKHDYKNALVHFSQEVKKNPTDCNALYYEAVTYHQLKQMPQAKNIYLKIVKTFPGTSASMNANAALLYIDPVYAKQHRAVNTNRPQPLASLNRGINYSNRSNAGFSSRVVNSAQTSSDFANLPDQVRVPYQREGQNLLIDAYVNGRPIQMFFDSGAESVVMRKSELESLGIKPPSGQHDTMSFGVGEGGGQRTWIMPVSLKVGTLERKNFPLNVQEDPLNGGASHPLLGQTFFRDFSCTLDPSSDGTRGTILFQKKTANRSFAANDSSIIPFSNMGKDVVVTAEINGHKIPMIFDTGAEMCVFTESQFAKLGLTIPDDASQGLDQGIAGITSSKRFALPQLRLGPIIKNDVNISVISNSAIPYPLLGNSFLHDLRIDIDNDSHQMRIRR